MLGIGITTRNRPNVLAWALKHFKEFPSSTSFSLVVVDDCSAVEHQVKNETVVNDYAFKYILNLERKGIAGSKNVCLRALAECERVFLFDDDCFPQHAFWDLPFVRLEYIHNIGHSSYIVHLADEKHQQQLLAQKKDFDVYGNGQGMCLYFTRACLSKIGEYDESFGIYGYEHSDMSLRAKAAGFCGGEAGPYLCPSEAKKFLYSLDLDYGWLKRYTSLGSFDFEFDTSIKKEEPLNDYLSISSKVYREKKY